MNFPSELKVVQRNCSEGIPVFVVDVLLKAKMPDLVPANQHIYYT